MSSVEAVSTWAFLGLNQAFQYVSDLSIAQALYSFYIMRKIVQYTPLRNSLVHQSAHGFVKWV